MFSPEKLQYLSEIEDEVQQEDDNISIITQYSTLVDKVYVDPAVFECIEYNFLDSIIYKSVAYYYKNYGDKPQVLFRREETYDELIKTICTTYGSKLFIDVYFNLKPIIDLNINPEIFANFYDKLLEILILETPFILKVMISLISDQVKSVFKVNGYEQILVILYFNFLFNPKIQEWNGYDIHNERLRDIGLIVNKICFNSSFKSSDKLYQFNSIIKSLHDKTMLTLECIIDSVKLPLDVRHKLLCENIYYSGILHPEYMFYIDSDFLLRILESLNLLNVNRKQTLFSLTSSKFS